uniref:241K polyprotein n=2 Tax=Capillovirus mali TaxID=28347 RepID=A0A1I7P2Z9_9VIRU|nr:241K polyprotein [Apple stem grooving virus]
MAFTYRNPLEIAINKLPSKQSDQLLSLTTDEIEKTLEVTNRFFSFSITPEDQELLTKHGLTLAPIGFKSHSHPISKMIENHLLYICIPSLLSSFRSVAFFSLRENKVNSFLKMHSVFSHGKIKSLGMYNAIIDGKDKYRYGDSSFSSFKDRVTGLRDQCLTRNKFPKVLFLHDELHFLSPFDIAFLFETIPEIDRVVATTVFPIELLFGDKVSKEPRVYTYKVHGSTFSFYPDGVASECYEQNLANSKWPFTCSGIQWANRKIRVTKLQSLFAHHVFSFDRGRACNEFNHFDKPSCLLAEEMRLLTKRFDKAVINRSTVSSLSTYMACLKTANAASAVAKLRQLEKRDLYPDELNFVYSFGEHFKNFGMRDDFDVSILQWVKDKFCQVMPHFIAASFFEPTEFHLNMRKLLNDLATKGIEVPLSVIILDKVNFIETRFHARMFEIAEAIGVNLASLGRRFDYETESEEYFSENGYLFMPSKACPDRNWILNSGTLKVDFSKIIKARRFRLKRDFIDPIVKGEIPRKQLFLELASNFESGMESVEGNKVQVAEAASSVVNSQPPNEAHVPMSTEDGQGFEGSLPIDLINTFEPEEIKLPKRKRKNDCVFKAIAAHLGIESQDLLNFLVNEDISDELLECIEEDKGLSHEMIEEVLVTKGLTMVYTSDFKEMAVLNRKYGVNGKMYCTIRANHCELSSKECFVRLLQEGGEAQMSNENLNADSLFDLGKFVHNKERAARLAKSMARGTTGLLNDFDPIFCKQMVTLSELFPENFSSTVGLRLGFAGSGKTHKVIQWINYTPSVKRMFISPRRMLADEVEVQLKGTACQVHTWETALKKIDGTFMEVFVDEIGLCPPGYLTLLQMCAFRKIVKGQSEKFLKSKLAELSKTCLNIRCFGDPLQLRYYSAEDTNLLDKTHEIDLMIKTIKHKYLLQGYRFGQWFQELISMPTRMDESKFSRKFFADISSVKTEDYGLILVAKREDKGVFAGRVPVATVSESQGMTISKRVLICLDQNLFAGGANAAIVAITRSKVGFDFVLKGNSLKEVQRMAQKTIWQFIIEGKTIPMERIVNMNPGASFYESPLDVGNSSIQDKASHDLFIMPFINLAEEEVDPEEVAGDVIEPVEWFKCHVPVFDTDPMLAEIFDKVAAKEKREFQSMLGMSNQFLDMEKNGCKIDILPFARQNVFPHHQASDDVTFWAGVQKRIRKSNWRREKSKFEEFESQGKELLSEFISMLPFEFKVNIKDIEDGEKSFLEKRKLKSEKMWANHSERSDIDWKLDHAFLFMKSQYCTKEGKMFTEAKAGQTLACFQHIVLFRFGPMLRAIESAFLRSCGESYYIHSGKNFFCLDSFVTKNADLFDGFSIESDYTAFDSSQDHVILAFEMALLQYLGVSKEFQMDYLRLKLTLGCRLGSLAIMRFTGEFCTFLFNTFANMLFTQLKYKIDPRKHRILFAGDDMCSLSSLKRRRGERATRLLKSFSLTAVEEVRKFPMFCGWYLSPYGIIKSPKLLWARIKMMSERQLLKECVDNYLFEAIFAYRLGERLYTILKEEDFEYHYLVIRFFVKNSKLLTGLSKSLIFEIGEGIGSEWQLSMSTISSKKSSQPISRLTRFPHLNYTRTQLFSSQTFSIASKGLSQMSKCHLDLETDWYFQISNSLMILKLTPLGKRVTSISTCTMELFWSGLKLCSQTLEGWKEGSLYMTVLVLTLKEGTFVHIYSSLNLTAATLVSDRNIAYQPLMLTWQRGSDLEWTLIAHNMSKTLSYSLLILVWLIDASILLVSWKQRQGIQDGLHRQSADVRLSNSMRKLKWPFWITNLRCFWRKVHQTCTLKRDYLEVTRLEGHARFLPKGGQTQNRRKREDLGPSQLELKDLAKMSLEDVLQQARRHRVGVYLWKTHIDPAKELLTVPPPESFKEGESFEGKELYLLLCNHYCKYLFGNIAVFGSSDKTQFPAVGFDTPPVHYNLTTTPKEGETEEQKKAREGSSGEKTKFWRIDLSNVVPELKTFAATSRQNSLNECTFRKLCEPFADLAREFLHERWSKGLATNIYKKWPKAFEKSPWVAFDFATGLKMNRLTPDEKQVIDRMTKRLFRTEGQKGVFEAGSESNLELEG